MARALAAIWTAAALVLALHLRPFEYCCEYDRYHEMAETVLAGRWPRDPFRPLGFVLLTAAIGFVAGSCFAAAKAIAALAAGALILATYALGKQTLGPRIGLVAAVFTACNPVLQQWALTAAPDTLFAFACTLLVVGVVAHRRQPSTATASRLGLVLAAAWFTRYQAISLAPIAAWAVATATAGAARRRHLAVFLVAMLVGLAPHVAVSYEQFGVPHHDENWRNLALRHFGVRDDWSYLHDNPFDGSWSVVGNDPLRMATNAAEECFGLVTYALPDMLVPGVAAPWRHVILLAILVGAIRALWRHGNVLLPITLSTIAYLALVCATFFALTRLLLPVLPACSLALAATWAGPQRPDGWGAIRLVRTARIAVAAAVLAIVATNGVARTRAFLANQHHQIVATVRMLAGTTARSLVVATNFEFLDRHAACRRAPLGLDADPAIVWRRIEALIAREHVDFVAFSRIDQEAMFDAFAASAPPGRLPVHVAVRDQDVLVYAVR